MNTYQYLWRLIMNRPVLYMVNALAWTAIYLAPIAPGLVTKQFFDILSGASGLSYGVWGIIALLLGATLARMMLIVFGFITDVHTRFRMGMMLRRNLLEHVLKQPGARAIPVSPGEAISHFRDDVDQSEEAASWSVDVFGMTCFAAVSSYILIRIDAQMTLLVFLPLVLVVTAAQLATARLMSELLDSVFSNSVNLGTGLILLLAGQKMRAGTFTVGDFALFVYYLTFVTQFNSNVGKFMTYFKQMSVALDRLTFLLQGAPAKMLTIVKPLYLKKRAAGLALANTEEQAVDSADHQTEPWEEAAPQPARIDALERLEVKQLSYRFPDTGRGIENVNFNLARGSFTVVTGAIGSGKTTLVRALLGLLPKTSGDVLWNGRPVEDLGEFFVPPRSAYTAQVPRLYSDTLRNNILLGQAETDDCLRRAIHTAVMEDDVAYLPRGLDSVIGPRGVKLSGGQAQRTAAARMLVRSAELYVFDDLSSALDVETEQKLWERLFKQRGDATCLVVSHRKAALHRADHVIVMKDGRIEAVGSAEQLLQSNRTFQELWYGDELRTVES
ncbi:ATP-binding cassette domain-containing protein [Paenibacillus hexagrammi]|uniref:ABC transporter ATP-binding protein/permease n=1 Tax=Paenibacillus hexagrammi TaxID=2908839 RepID=A0ABY3SNB9_9BACL|nr:ABC transporter ATP-binding protein [Paenibacillus sp. YPD9-1]UJF35441.1 ABC transporter ATP-binding protein/permease [Paenibacillus sp. YPD9-1]